MTPIEIQRKKLTPQKIVVHSLPSAYNEPRLDVSTIAAFGYTHFTMKHYLLLATSIVSRTNAFTPLAALSSTSSSFSRFTKASSSIFQMSSTAVAADTLTGAQSMIDSILDEKNCGPVMVRLAWHDSGTYDVNLKDEPWPKAGGAIGSIRFAPEITHGANAGLANAVALLEPVKAAYPDMSYADIFQMASARAIELAGGPKIDMKYVRRI
jgi:Peroxidase